jgi:cation transport ATPase
MKKTLTATILLLLLVAQSQLFSQCPWNKVNCAHGCGRHFDENGDGFCDYSIIDKSLLQNKEVKQDEQKTIEKEEIKNNIKKVSIDTSNTHKKAIQKEDIAKSKNKTEDNTETTKHTQEVYIETVITKDLNSVIELNNEEIQAPAKKQKPYDLIFISFLTCFLYSLSFILSKLNIIRKIYHRRLWNFVLLITFLISCLFGFFLVIQINYNIVMDWFRTLLYWHVQIGISMTIISIFHIFWHLKYFKNLLKTANKNS